MKQVEKEIILKNFTNLFFFISGIIKAIKYKINNPIKGNPFIIVNTIHSLFLISHLTQWFHTFRAFI